MESLNPVIYINRKIEIEIKKNKIKKIEYIKKKKRKSKIEK